MVQNKMMLIIHRGRILNTIASCSTLNAVFQPIPTSYPSWEPFWDHTPGPVLSLQGRNTSGIVGLSSFSVRKGGAKRNYLDILCPRLVFLVCCISFSFSNHSSHSHRWYSHYCYLLRLESFVESLASSIFIRALLLESLFIWLKWAVICLLLESWYTSCFSYFSHCWNKISNIHNLKEKGFILAHSL